jgi:uncharacterized protein YjdB
MTIGDTLLLTATIVPSDATNKNVTWTSTATAVASVLNGTVIALTEGTTSIIATTANGGKTAICNVTVNPKIPDIIRVESVSLNKTADTLDVGDSLTLTATVLPANADNKAVSWSSSNTAVAKVVNGKVMTISAGSTTITVTTEDGNKTATCSIVVNKPTIAKTVTVGTQNSTPVAGVNSNVTFPVTTTGIANGTYELTINNPPPGITYQLGATVTITNNIGTLQLTCRGNGTVAGTYTNLTLIIDGVTSAPFTLIIAAP